MLIARASRRFHFLQNAKSKTARNMATTPIPSTSSRLQDAQPAFIYGTAWKKAQTKTLVKEALVAGFRRVDTAAQPRHYQEHLVGEALREAYSEEIVKREDVYVRIIRCILGCNAHL
jgi:predicted aldo/keto reductase-like oxidoreductase